MQILREELLDIDTRGIRVERIITKKRERRFELGERRKERIRHLRLFVKTRDKRRS